MQEVKKLNNALQSEGKKPKEVNTCSLNEIFHKNFVNGLQNARNLLARLEHSIEKSTSYEDKLLKCSASHKHSHDYNDWIWDSDFSDKDFQSSKSSSAVNKSIKDTNNILESWSTMSIVCLQYQYEELSKRYEALLKAFNDKCSVLYAHNSTISRLRERVRVMHAHLAAAHRTLICVGEKYLALKKRRQEQFQHYDKKIAFLKGRVQEVLATAESARLHLDHKLAHSMVGERDSEYSMLLAEMRKCNQLYLENLQLKAQLEEHMPGSIWTT